MFKNVLVLAPHTDDGELGAGGFISKLRTSGALVTYVAFSAAEESVPTGFATDVLRKEVVSANRMLGLSAENVECLQYKVRKFEYSRQEILEDMIALRRRINPDLVLLPSQSDIHQDHGVISAEGVRAFKNCCVLGYELPWNNLSFSATCFVRLDEDCLENKIRALGCYESQYGRDYMSEDYIRSHARFRGVQVGSKFAEAFEVIRWHIL